jgi:hypothetical protein
MSYSAADFVQDIEGIAADRDVPPMTFKEYCEKTGYDVSDGFDEDGDSEDEESEGEAGLRVLTERIDNALAQRLDLLRACELALGGIAGLFDNEFSFNGRTLEMLNQIFAAVSNALRHSKPVAAKDDAKPTATPVRACATCKHKLVTQPKPNEILVGEPHGYWLCTNPRYAVYDVVSGLPLNLSCTTSRTNHVIYDDKRFRACGSDGEGYEPLGVSP